MNELFTLSSNSILDRAFSLDGVASPILRIVLAFQCLHSSVAALRLAATYVVVRSSIDLLVGVICVLCDSLSGDSPSILSSVLFPEWIHHLLVSLVIR